MTDPSAPEGRKASSRQFQVRPDKMRRPRSTYVRPAWCLTETNGVMFIGKGGGLGSWRLTRWRPDLGGGSMYMAYMYTRART